MNKMLTKLTTTFIGMAMAIGVGMAVSMNNKEISPAYADNDISISETTTGTSYTSTNFNISSGGATNSNYYKLGNATFTSKNSYNIDSNKSISYIIKTRKFNGPSDAQAVVNLSLLNGSTTVATASFSPTNTTLTSYDGTFTVTGDTSDVKFVIKGNGESGGGKGVGISEIKFTATSSSGGGGDEPGEEGTGTIIFGNQTGQYSLNGSNLSPTDSLSYTWTATPVWASGYTASYTNTNGKVQIGAKSSDSDKKWITSLTFVLTLSDAYYVTAFSVKTSGFAETDGTATLKVGNTVVGSGTIGNSETTTAATDLTQSGTQLTVILEGNPRMRFYLHEISYTIDSSGSSTAVLDHIDLSGSYPTTFTQGDSFSHDGMTVMAVYDDELEVDVTSDVSFSGYDMSTAGNQTVTVTYNDGTTEKTATYSITVNAAPIITISASTNLNGYTGESFSVTATYSNLSGSFAWGTPTGVGSIDGSVTATTGTSTNGSSTFSGTLTGAGNVTLPTSGGGVSNAPSVQFTITASSVTITGLPESSSVFVKKTLDLGSTITVTAKGIYSDGVTWESAADDIATVDENGVVTGVADGTVDIIVTSDDYSSATMTCSVTVKEAAIYTLVTDPSTLVSGTQFVLVGYAASTYRIAKDLDSGHIKMNTITSKTEVDGRTSGSDLITEEADVFTLVGSSDNWEIKRGDTYLKFTGTGNGDDSFVNVSSDDTKFSITKGSDNKLTINSNSRSNRALRYNTNTGDLRNYSNSGVQLDLFMFAIIPATLDSVTTTGQTTSFTAGNKFSYGGTLSAHYTQGKADATVTPTLYKFGESNINPASSGTEISTSTDLKHDTHNGKYIYVGYTEDGITKWTSGYQITVNYAPITSVEIGTHKVEIALNELFDYSKVTVTVNSQCLEDENKGYEWIVAANTVDDDYIMDGSGLLSGDTEGTITLRCRSTYDNSKYDELIVTVKDEPIATFTPSSVDGYVNKSADVAFTYTNIDDESLISVTSGNTSCVTIGEIVADEGDGLVTINFVAVGSTTISISYNGGEALNTIPVSVSADSVKEVTWTAPTINVYSGASLSNATGWNVHYEMNSGDEGDLTSGFNIKLDGVTISLPYEWKADDDGKALCVEYGGVSSETTTVSVAQTLRPVMADVWGEPETSTLTFTAACGGSGTADDDASWAVTSDAPESIYDSSRGIHYGTNSSQEVQYVQLVTSDIAMENNQKVISVAVNCTDAAGSGSLTVEVGSTSFVNGDKTSTKVSSTQSTYTYTGEANGTITVKIDRGGSAFKAIYVKSIVVTYKTLTGTTNIANIAGHEAAQKAVAKFAKAFNAAMDTTSGCTTNMSSAWTTAKAAWSTFETDISSLSDSEQEYAKNLIKYATIQWTTDTDSDLSYSLERCLATYERCVTNHGQEAFMDSVRPVAATAKPVLLGIDIANNGENILLVIATLTLVAFAFGGYTYFRKKKQF